MGNNKNLTDGLDSIREAIQNASVHVADAIDRQTKALRNDTDTNTDVVEEGRTTRAFFSGGSIREGETEADTIEFDGSVYDQPLFVSHEVQALLQETPHQFVRPPWRRPQTTAYRVNVPRSYAAQRCRLCNLTPGNPVHWVKIGEDD